MLGNYFLELEPGNYQAEEANNIPDIQPDLLWFLWANEFDCNIVDLVSYVVRNSNARVESFWILYFDGSKTLEVSGAGYVLINQEKINIFFHVG